MNKDLKIIGLISIISYMTVVLFTWIYVSLNDNVYFMVGEPVTLIKYIEWGIGFIGIYIAIYYLFEELKKISYKELK